MYVTGFEKTRFPHIIRNIYLNYLKYYNSGRETDGCMKIAIYNHELLDEKITEFPTILDRFYWHSQYQ